MTPITKLHLGLAVLCAVALSPTAVLAANPRSHQEHGTITSVDVVAHTIAVSGNGDHASHNYQWNDHTKFTEHGKAASAADLKSGDRVRLTYKRAGGETPTIEQAQLMPAKNTKS